MDSFLLDTSFSKCHYDPNAYTKKVGNHLIFITHYVDVLIITRTGENLLTHVKYDLKKKFEMAYL